LRAGFLAAVLRFGAAFLAAGLRFATFLLVAILASLPEAKIFAS
jgi:hypothetical protein